jgi:agmatine deiminase
MRACRSERIVLDGGNVVASRAKVILTDKVFVENPAVARQRLLRRLEQAFAAECVVIPRQRGDVVGHADGVVRFLSEGRAVMNDYSGIDPGYGEAVAAILRDAGLEVETLPHFEDGREPPEGELPSAAGVYVNYARVGDFVALPAFGRPEDGPALRKFRRLLPGARVVPVPCRELADEGGVLNCVTWVARA